MRPKLGQPLVADGPQFVQTRRALPADQEEREDDDAGRTAQNEWEPDGHGAIVSDSAHVRNVITTEREDVVGDVGLLTTSQLG